MEFSWLYALFFWIPHLKNPPYSYSHSLACKTAPNPVTSGPKWRQWSHIEEMMWAVVAIWHVDTCGTLEPLPGWAKIHATHVKTQEILRDLFLLVQRPSLCRFAKPAQAGKNHGQIKFCCLNWVHFFLGDVHMGFDAMQLLLLNPIFAA